MKPAVNLVVVSLPDATDDHEALAAFPTESFVTFEEMHARYEKLHGVAIDIAAEAAAIARRRTGSRK